MEPSICAPGFGSNVAPNLDELNQRLIERGRIWLELLRREARAARLEVQAAELELALIEAEIGKSDCLEQWLQRNPVSLGVQDPASLTKPGEPTRSHQLRGIPSSRSAESSKDAEASVADNPESPSDSIRSMAAPLVPARSGNSAEELKVISMVGMPVEGSLPSTTAMPLSWDHFEREAQKRQSAEVQYVQQELVNNLDSDATPRNASGAGEMATADCKLYPEKPHRTRTRKSNLRQASKSLSAKRENQVLLTKTICSDGEPIVDSEKGEEAGFVTLDPLTTRHLTAGDRSGVYAERESAEIDEPFEWTAIRSSSRSRENNRSAKKLGRGLGMSATVHAVLVIALATMTIHLPERPASLAFLASVDGDADEVLEVIDSIEVLEPDASELTASSVDASAATQEIQQALGEFAATNSANALSSATAPSVSIAGGLASGGSPGRTMGAGGGPKITSASASFFGVESGGNSFCYIVDSSGSMRGGAWEAAKRELVRSLMTLKSSQRFFIVFFNAEVEGLPAPGEREPSLHALYATPENVDHARRWIESIVIGRGGPPNEALKLAISREPDAIYLLTDGVTKVDVCEFLREENRTQDLLSGDAVRVPIHTIAYYSLDGQALLRQIAKENKGQFHYVPEPRKK